MSFSSKISKQRLQILTFQIRPLIWQLAFILLEFWEPLVITLQSNASENLLSYLFVFSVLNSLFPCLMIGLVQYF
ncbi:hypothetical protein WN943_003482 [Citrus x changshan-huyou]